MAVKIEKKNAGFLLLILVFLVFAFFVRFYHLENRPCHHDESSNGWFIEKLYTKGEYQYAPQHFHGPTFFYLGWMFSRFFGLDLLSIRYTSAAFGFLLCFAPFLLLGEIKKKGVLVTLLLLAITPAQLYYSRYAIHEILLICFFTYSAIFLYIYWFYGGLLFAVCSAFFLAAAAATKETVVVGVISLVLGSAFAFVGSQEGSWQLFKERCTPKSILVYLAVLFVGLLSWFSPSELFAFFKSYIFYLHLGTEKTGHEKPWTYFFLLLWRVEWLVFLGGIAGAISALRTRKPFALFCLGWALGILFLHAVIAYKTPWIIVNMTVPLTFLVGCFVADMGDRLKKKSAKIGAACGLLLLIGITARTSYRYSFQVYTEPENRFSYVQTLPSAVVMENRIRELTKKYPEIQVAIVADEVWPYPFILRDVKQIVYYSGQVPDKLKAQVIVARDNQYAKVSAVLGGVFRREDYPMRPGVNLQLFIAEELLK